MSGSHEPIEPQYVEDMNAIARTLDEAFNGVLRGSHRKTGFVLLVFPFGNPKRNRMNYISNGADRGDIVVALKELVANFEGRLHTGGRA